MKKLECEGEREMETSELIKKAMEIEGINDYRQGGRNVMFLRIKTKWDSGVCEPD